MLRIIINYYLLNILLIVVSKLVTFSLFVFFISPLAFTSSLDSEGSSLVKEGAIKFDLLTKLFNSCI